MDYANSNKRNIITTVQKIEYNKAILQNYTFYSECGVHYLVFFVSGMVTDLQRWYGTYLFLLVTIFHNFINLVLLFNQIV